MKLSKCGQKLRSNLEITCLCKLNMFLSLCFSFSLSSASKTGTIIFGGSDVDHFIKSLEANNTPHQVLSGEEANLKYPHQLQLPNDYTCVFEEHGGILRASKAVATIQVSKNDLCISNSLSLSLSGSFYSTWRSTVRQS